MTFDSAGQSALDYLHCRYGQSRLLFRGPRRKLEGCYAAFFGGTETYGKFVEEPFPELVEAATGTRCVNFGCLNAGADLYVNDPTLIDAAARAAVTVVQVMGAQNMSNRFYAVHPRRNDRFLRASSLMKTVFREVDFTEFNFTRHMLATLHRVSAEKYAMVVEELKSAWVARMQTMLAKIPGKVVLLWVHDRRERCRDEVHDCLGNDPLFVEPEMVEQLRPKLAAVVEVTPSAAAWRAGTAGMVFTEMEAPAAEEMPGPAVHQEIAEALAPEIARLMK
ncbi:DUF6473 family protein [Vannielia litorea]|uniref:DUF6473 domain-containing protein n=1 Tax=Vannielia litorea TaxID=1217970 RepID=A0A1N6IN23_9RHOB|nr:DUF6473 family protein [Vannielia litorea]SIO33383.1 hypothetical protein SAMN05444002_4093 [Vannielia litorea]